MQIQKKVGQDGKTVYRNLKTNVSQVLQNGRILKKVLSHLVVITILTIDQANVVMRIVEAQPLFWSLDKITIVV